MSLSIKSPGLLSTLQDTGRWGHQKEGVLVNGAMDKLALRIGNILTGNMQNAAAMEISQIGPQIYFEKDQLIAVTGAEAKPTINRQNVQQWRPVWVKQGSLLEFKPMQNGRFAYLAVAGGFDVPPIMGSRSTYLKAGFGGFGGRALEAGDLLHCGKPSEAVLQLTEQLRQKATTGCFSQTKWHTAAAPAQKKAALTIIHFLEGPEWHLFSPDSRTAFLQEVFEVSLQSDRMGYRLRGPSLALSETAELLSAAVSFGTVQVPPNGQPIVLLADHQTTGGYPRIAQLASTDLSSMAQLLPGQKIKFKLITLQQAHKLYMEQEKRLKQLALAISLKFKQTA